MYFADSVVAKASTTSIDLARLSPTFHTGSKSAKFASFSTSLKFEPLAFENAARYPNSQTKVQCCDDRPMSWPIWRSWVHALLRKLSSFVSSDPPPKIAREYALNRQ